MRFKDNIVLVTGASQNTGVDVARRFLAEGAQVMINSDQEQDLAAVYAALATEYPGQLASFVADISDEEAVKAMFEALDRRFGRIDILINNACNQGIGPAFDEVTAEAFIQVIRVNLVGTFLVSQQAVSRMLKQEHRGVIVNISSNVSKRAIHNRSAYVASKSGIDGLTKAMAVDLGAKGCVSYRNEPLANYRDFLETIPEIYWASYPWMVNRGIFMTPGDEEQWTVSVQHTESDVQTYVDAFGAFCQELTA